MSETPPAVVLQLSTIEIAQLTVLVEQFAELVDESSPADAALDRLAPDAYPDDAGASREFRRLTRGELLSRRASDATAVLSSLRGVADIPDPTQLSDEAARVVELLPLEGDDVTVWMRTLTALRLVLATRLGIRDDEQVVDDPRGFVYDWLGVLLDGIVRAVSPDDDPLTAS